MVAPNVGEPVRNESVPVGATSVLLSNAKPRKEIYVTNTGATNITISIGIPAVAGAGILIGPLGYWFGSVGNNFKPVEHDIFVISSAAGGTLAIFER
jgi:hypothetical protein